MKCWRKWFPAQVHNPQAAVDPGLHDTEAELPHCQRKTCGHSALLHQGWPERGDTCLSDCGCKRLIL